GRTQERLPPRTDGVSIAGLLRLAASAVLTADLEGALHPVIDRMVGGLEPEDEQSGVGSGAGQRRLGGIEQTAVRWMQSALRNRSHRFRARREVAEPHARRRLEPRSLLDAHPGLRYHAEDPLGAEQEPVR